MLQFFFFVEKSGTTAIMMTLMLKTLNFGAGGLADTNLHVFLFFFSEAIASVMECGHTGKGVSCVKNGFASLVNQDVLKQRGICFREFALQ